MNRLHLCGWPLALGLLVLGVPGPSRGQGPEYLGKSPAAWAKGLDSNDPVERRSAAFALGKLGAGSAGHLPRLLQLLGEDGAASVRQAAAWAAGEIGKAVARPGDTARLLPSLKTALAKDPDPLVRRSAAVALGTLGRQAGKAQGALERALGDASPEVRQNAAWALGRVGGDSVAALRKVMTDPDPLLLREAARSLGRQGDGAHAALPELLACCDHPDVEVRKAAVAALVGLVRPEDGQACAALGKVLRDRDREVRYNAALALGKVGGAPAAAAVPVLIEALRQKEDPGLRQQAAAALGNIGPAAAPALDPLRQALKDPDPGLRRNAAIGLGGLGNAAEPAYGDLVGRVTNPKEDEQVRVQAAVALSRIRALPAVRAAAPALIGVVKDASNPAEVRLRSLWALRVLNQDLKDYPELFDALGRIVVEPKRPEKRMLRYDAAYLLGVFQRAKISEQALDVLNDFLRDDTLQLYAGIQPENGPIPAEGHAKPGRPVEVGRGDGRVMAVQALRVIGPDRVRRRPDILQSLRALQNSPDQQLRREVAQVLDNLMR